LQSRKDGVRRILPTRCRNTRGGFAAKKAAPKLLRPLQSVDASGDYGTAMPSCTRAEAAVIALFPGEIDASRFGGGNGAAMARP